MVRIITDSAADFEPAEMERMGIFCIPLTVIFGEKAYQENVDLSKDQFYRLLAGSVENPKTAQPSPQLFMDLLEDAKAHGDEAVYITLSSALSGTHQSAVMTRNLVGHDGAYVVDGRNATGGQRILVEYAVKLRDEGKNAAQIAEAVESLRGRITLFACMDTLEYLYRGGRISQTVYKLGSLAQIKPIISLDREGKVIIPAKAMGMRKGIDYMCKQLEQKPSDGSLPLYVMYTHNRTNGEALAKRVREMGYDVPDSRIINVGAAIGTHIGPDACGLVYVAAE